MNFCSWWQLHILYSFNCFGPADIVIATTIADIAFDTNVLVLFYITTKASCIYAFNQKLISKTQAGQIHTSVQVGVMLTMLQFWGVSASAHMKIAAGRLGNGAELPRSCNPIPYRGNENFLSDGDKMLEVGSFYMRLQWAESYWPSLNLGWSLVQRICSQAFVMYQRLALLV